MNFEIVIGLEVHCELKTKSKMFSASPVSFGAPANTMANSTDLAMTGTMPVVNKSGVEYAIRVCHALHMEIDELLRFDRKNYYYADLPKGFQITQDRYPIGRNGKLELEVHGKTEIVEIERLHMEEDTAKQLHMSDYSLLDYNRAGIPLIEIVTRPTIRSGKGAAAYLERLRQIFLFTEVSDAKMEEGSMRCDVNISLRPYGSDTLGIRTEIKNLNSISNVQKAIEFEARRQEKLLLSGKSVLQQTMRYNEETKETVAMRSKGDAVDYKYYPEPNIPPIRIAHAWVEAIKNKLPEMPDMRKQRYITTYHIPPTDADILVQSKEMSDFFEACLLHTKEYKLISNWLLGDVQAYMNKHGLTISQLQLTPAFLATIITCITDGSISSKQAKKVFELVVTTGKDPLQVIEENNMKQISSPEQLAPIINGILDNNSQSIEDYQNGKDRAIGFLVGQIMKATNGQANPALTSKLLIQLLQERIQK